jgi:hypothetical protein
MLNSRYTWSWDDYWEQFGRDAGGPEAVAEAEAEATVTPVEEVAALPTPPEVDETTVAICRDYSDFVSMKALAAKYGKSEKTIKRIVEKAGLYRPAKSSAKSAGTVEA